MSIFTEHTVPQQKTVYVAEVLFRTALFYSVTTMVFGLGSLIEAPQAAAYDDNLSIMLAQDGTLFVVMSAWFAALAIFFRQRPYGLTLSAWLAQGFLFLQFAIFAGAMWPLASN